MTRIWLWIHLSLVHVLLLRTERAVALGRPLPKLFAPKKEPSNDLQPLLPLPSRLPPLQCPPCPFLNSSPAKDIAAGDSTHPYISGLQNMSERWRENWGSWVRVTLWRKEDHEERLVLCCPLLVMGSSAASLQSTKLSALPN